MTKASHQQIGAIHALKTQLGLDDSTYRTMLTNQTGQASAAKLDSAQAGRVITHLKALQGGNQTRSRQSLEGPHVAIARALWISGFHLGVVRDRTDAALINFVSRQAHIDHLTWVRDAPQGAAVVEALKAMLAREAGVIWPNRKQDSATNRKLAVFEAQLRLLDRFEDVPTENNFHAVITRLGRLVRQKRGQN